MGFSYAGVCNGHCCIGGKSAKASPEAPTKSVGDFENFRPNRVNATVPVGLGDFTNMLAGSLRGQAYGQQ